MKKTPFTQEKLAEIYEENGLVSFELLENHLIGWRTEDIKLRLSQWRYRGVIDYTLKDGELEDFRLLRDKRANVQEMTEGRRLKLEEYYKQVMATAEVIHKSGIKDVSRLKAIELQQKAMSKIPDNYYKELYELYN